MNAKNLIEDLLGSRARIKVLKVLALHEELNISSIIKKTKLNHTIVTRHLQYLEFVDLVQAQTFGRVKMYRFKNENMKARKFKKFLEMWENDLEMRETFINY